LIQVLVTQWRWLRACSALFGRLPLVVPLYTQDFRIKIHIFITCNQVIFITCNQVIFITCNQVILLLASSVYDPVLLYSVFQTQFQYACTGYEIRYVNAAQ